MKNLILLTVLLGTVVCYGANNVTQWRGEERRGIFHEKNLLKDWKAQPPKELWFTEELGDTYASVVVVDGKVYTTGITRYDTDEDDPKEEGKKIQNYDGRELLYALDAKDGKLLWSVQYGESAGGKDPKGRVYPPARCTPTYADGHLYAVTGNGDIACVSTDGKIVWQANLEKDFGGRKPQFGWSVMPVVHDNKVIFPVFSTEGEMIALDAKTGKKVWLSEPLPDSGPSNVSPNLVDHKGKKKVIGINGSYIYGIDPADGKFQWRAPLTEDLKANSPEGSHWGAYNITPVLVDDLVISSAGYKMGTYAYRVNDAFTEAKFEWINTDFDSRHYHFVVDDGAVWIVGGQSTMSGYLGALDIKTGKEITKTQWKQVGSVTAADGMLYCQAEWAGLSLFEMNKDEIAHRGGIGIRGLLKDKQHFNWSHPVIADGVLYARKGNALTAFDVKK